MNFITLDNLNQNQIVEVFALADSLKDKTYTNLLKGKTIVLFFPESSIRTRITFEKAVKALGGDTILFPPETLDKREELRDVIKYLENWADCVIVRHRDLTKLEEMAKYGNIPIINAMTSINHPCEIMSDLYSIKQMKPEYQNLTYTFVGENGNISKSWVNVAKVMKLNLNHVCIENQRIKEDDDCYHFYTELEEVLKETDVVLTDPLSSQIKSDDYIKNYQITLDRMKLTKKNSILNPCPPFYRNEEVSEDVINSDYFVGYEFKKNLLYVQQAILLYCMGINIV